MTTSTSANDLQYSDADRAAFTPGPWHAVEESVWRADNSGNQPSSVCHVGDYTIVTEYPSYEFHGPDEADARLIAAAPDLYAALVFVRDNYGQDALYIASVIDPALSKARDGSPSTEER